MKSFILSLVICGAICVSGAQAQECANGRCTPVRNAVVAVHRVTQTAAVASVATVKRVAAVPKRFAQRVRRLSFRGCGCCN